MSEQQTKTPNFWALTPLILFLALYLGSSIILGDFYKVPIAIAFLIASIYAIATMRKEKLEERIRIFCQGAGNHNIVLMIWIFVLAGAFAQSAKAMGAIDATVYATLKALPNGFLLPGLFVAACFISLSIGTSVGTIATLVPVAIGVAEQTDLNLAMVVAIIVGGAYFGDNLSFISDTTIIATKSQGCKMSDKFKANSYIAFPAALIMLAYYTIIGQDVNIPSNLPDVEWIKVIPYLCVLATVLAGIDVMIVLAIGIGLTGLIGIATGSYDFFGWLAAMDQGVKGMSELIIVTLLAGGMLEIIRHNGGIPYLTQKITKHVKGKKGGELCIAALVILSDMCTANNTIAIVTTGSIAKEISEKYGIDNRRTASLLDTFACFAQGLIPYGAQMLIAAGSILSPIEIMRYLYYPMIIGVIALISIFVRYPKKYA